MRTLIAIVVLFIIAGGGYFLYANQAQAPTQEADQAMMDDTMSTTTDSAMMDEEPMGDPIFHALISYTNDGFDPAEVTIKKGETVRFVNNSDRDTWPASAIHPTHSIYPEKTDADCLGSAFDACRPLKAGEFWEFTFNEAGEWGFHDHLQASDRGKVIVTEE
ncbi:hypothetical protein COU17_02505 [Candidatus Kaiserbacteria bacterium CG10_big_fil_rev_8_21_14_0_10_49_17]|uniref:EfeO-type cupredoxin-like domain-containing protein n=1 Tax=Candidatus Kaiserbacteria bacterium CG10_big_fil_rev_8_21_14_0_10_49_17 TaxID=1974609 RepID=A0A2M6WE12_9BACT|nr:MAG: hypothetical protein COU17_02505 [Candidatus Kaiserbacteria bacterium CG10_big_fil_rev_8_21_14_0_10_49_17]